MRRISKRGVIYPTMVCNIKCEFCYYRYLKNKNHQSFEEVKKKLDKFKFYYDLTYVDITGGEPTIYPHIKEMIRHCNKIDLKPTIITNAQIPKVFPELITLGLEDLLISIHGTQEDHDKAVGKSDAFKRVCETIETLKNINFTFRTNTTITQHNFRNLPKLAKFLKRIEPRIANFIIFNPHEGTLWARQFNVKFQVKYTEIAPYLKEAIDIMMRNGIWVNVRYFPVCLLRGYEKHICNFHQWQYDPYEWEYKSSWNLSKNEQGRLIVEAKKAGTYGHADEEKLHNYLTKREIRGSRKSGRNFLNRIYNHLRGRQKGNIFTEKCKDCINFLICDGIYPQYARSFGVGEFKLLEDDIYIRDPLYYRRQDTRWARTKPLF